MFDDREAEADGIMPLRVAPKRQSPGKSLLKQSSGLDGAGGRKAATVVQNAPPPREVPWWLKISGAPVNSAEDAMDHFLYDPEMRKLEKTCLKAWHLNSAHLDLISQLPEDMAKDMLHWHGHVSDFLLHRQQVAEMHVRKAHLSERWAKKKTNEFDFDNDYDDDDDEPDERGRTPDITEEKEAKSSSSTAPPAPESPSRSAGRTHMQVLAKSDLREPAPSGPTAGRARKASVSFAAATSLTENQSTGSRGLGKRASVAGGRLARAGAAMTGIDEKSVDSEKNNRKGAVGRRPSVLRAKPPAPSSNLSASNGLNSVNESGTIPEEDQ